MNNQRKDNTGKQSRQVSLGRVSANVTVWELLRERALIQPDAVAIEDRGKVFTYRDLTQRVNELSAAFHARGFKQGDTIAILSENRHEYIELILAAARIGIAVACLNWRFAQDELTASIALAAPALLFVSEKFIHLALPPDVRRIVLGDEYDVLLDSSSPAITAQSVDAESILTLLYTSGTTGQPKAAMISQRAIVARAMMMIADGIVIPGLAFVAWAPFFHIGANDTSLATLMHGGKVILVDGFQPDVIIDAIRNNTIGWLSLAGVVSRLAEELKRNPVDAPQIANVGSMADLVPRGDIQAITSLLRAPFLNSFGSTETGLAPASAGRLPIGELPEKFLKQQSSLCLLRLIDHNGDDVPDGTPGALIMRGPTLFSGYWRNPEATAEVFRDDWYHMGDMFIRHPGGLEFVGREKYLIKSGGENIYPAEIEQLVLGSARVHEAVLVGHRDDRWGEIPVLLVAAKDPALTPEDITKLYDGKVARYKQPKLILFVKDTFFPRSSTGKVKRNEIKVSSLIDTGTKALR